MKEFNEDSVRELYLCTINLAEIYYHNTRPYILCLANKFKKGEYKPTAALKGYKRIAIEGAKIYCINFCNTLDYKTIFSPADITETAERMEKYYKQEVEEAAENE